MRPVHDDRLERLREAGLTEPELTRLASPIGLDLGARTPEETAVSIAAEIIAFRWGGQGSRLTDVRGPIHHPARHHSLSDAEGSAPGAARPVQDGRRASSVQSIPVLSENRNPT